MERTTVACRGDRFLGAPPEPGPSGSGLLPVTAAALGSVFLHGSIALGLALLARPSERVTAFAEIPIEVVIDTPLPAPSEPLLLDAPEPVRATEIVGQEIGPASSDRLEAPARELAAGPPDQLRAGAPSSLGLAQEALRAVAVPPPAAPGDEAMRYDVAVLSRLERAKQFPKAASLRGARGTAVVGFALDESGRVIVAALLRSSGDRDLDGESLAVIHRAAPFPKPPPGARRRFAVDIAFGMSG